MGFYFFLAGTPNPAVWNRVIFWGSNSTHYYYYLIERIQSGSHYSYTDSIYLCEKPKFCHLKEKKILLKKIHYFDKDALGNWDFKIDTKSSINVDDYLAKNNAFYSFQHLYNLQMQKDGIYMIYEKSRNRVLDLNGLKKCVNWEIFSEFLNEKNQEGFPRIINIYADNAILKEMNKINEEYCYLLVQYGWGTYDSDIFQSIIPISRDKLEAAWGKFRNK
jgi:hypothetical protein